VWANTSTRATPRDLARTQHTNVAEENSHVYSSNAHLYSETFHRTEDSGKKTTDLRYNHTN
jgi:hypothetical protein